MISIIDTSPCILIFELTDESVDFKPLFQIAILSNALVAGLTSDMIPRTVYATVYGPCGDQSVFTRFLSSECYDGYSNFSLQPVNIASLDYGSYGNKKDGSPLTLGNLWQNKTLSNNFKFENMTPDGNFLT